MRSEQALKLARRLGDLIRQHRTLLYTQSTFAKMIGVSRSTVQKLEQGEVVKSDILFEALVVLQPDGVEVKAEGGPVAVKMALKVVPQHPRKLVRVKDVGTGGDKLTTR